MSKRQIFLTVLLVMSANAILRVRAAEGVSFPANFRQWAHVKSVLVGPASPFFGRVGGWHHVYANGLALEGLRTGEFKDGAVFVFDVLEAREINGSTIEGPRRFIDVMEKDSKRFAATGGWGYEEFTGGEPAARALSEQAALQCYSCHKTANSSDSVFSKLRE